MYIVAGVGDRMLRSIHCSKHKCLLPVHSSWVTMAGLPCPSIPPNSQLLHLEDRCAYSPPNTFPKTLLSLFRMRQSGGKSPSCLWGICYRRRKKNHLAVFLTDLSCVCLVRFILSFITTLPSFTLNMKLIRKDPHHSLKKNN